MAASASRRQIVSARDVHPDDETTGRWSAGNSLEGHEPAPDLPPLDESIRNAHGFLVDTTHGREVGVVEDIVVDPATGKVVRIEVCGGWFGRRRRTIAPYQVEAIDPSIRLLVVAESAVQDARR